MPEETPTGDVQDETEVIDGIEVYLRRMSRRVVAFDDVKIKLLTRQGRPVPSGTQRVFGGYFEIEATGVHKLFVKKASISGASVVFDYATVGEFDLPTSLEVGTGGILQKTVPDLFPSRSSRVR